MANLIFIGLFTLTACLTTSLSVNIECNYSIQPYYAKGNLYSCVVQNNLEIESPETSQINTITGNHQFMRKNSHVQYFFINGKNSKYFPRGLEKFFINIKGILIFTNTFKEIHQRDLKPFTGLEYFQVRLNNFEIIENGLFDYNPNLEIIIFENHKIFHIHPTVFDNLNKLVSLVLSGGSGCVLKDAHLNRAAVLELIASVKNTCVSQDYKKLDEKLKCIESASKSLNHEKIEQNLKIFENEFKNSKFFGFSPLKERFESLKSMTMTCYELTDVPKSNEVCQASEDPLNKFDDLKEQIEANYSNLNTSISELRTSQIDTFNDEFATLGDKFLDLNVKISSLNDKIDEKFEDIESSMKKMRLKIDLLEKKLIEKIDKNFIKILKAIKNEN